ARKYQPHVLVVRQATLQATQRVAQNPAVATENTARAHHIEAPHLHYGRTRVRPGVAARHPDICRLAQWYRAQAHACACASSRPPVSVPPSKVPARQADLFCWKEVEPLVSFPTPGNTCRPAATPLRVHWPSTDGQSSVCSSTRSHR